MNTEGHHKKAGAYWLLPVLMVLPLAVILGAALILFGPVLAKVLHVIIKLAVMG